MSYAQPWAEVALRKNIRVPGVPLQAIFSLIANHSTGEEIQNLQRVMEEDVMDESGRNHPYMAREDDCIVLYVEQQEVVRLPVTEEGHSLLLWECCHWIFNLKTQKSVANLNWFLREKVFNGLKVDRAPTAKAKEVVSRMMD